MIEIDDDCVDSIIQEAIVWHYVHLTDDLKNVKNLHPDDREAYEKVAEACKVLGGWFFAHGEFDAAVKKARKKK